MPTLAATLAAFALTAAPASAGSDGCPDDSDCRPAASPPPALVPVPQPTTRDEDSAPDSTRHHEAAVQTVPVAQQTVPVGAVAAGAGGTALQSSDTILAFIAAGGLLLVTTGGGIALAGRRAS